jgi:hypothetical protein
MGLNTCTARVLFCRLYTHGPHSSDFPVTEFSPRYSSTYYENINFGSDIAKLICL